MVRAVRLVEAVLQLSGSDCAPPEKTVLLGPRRNDPETAPRSRGHTPAANAVDDRRVHLILAPVAIDRGAGCVRDNCADPALNRAPHEPVDERILETAQGIASARRHGDQPIRIVATGM